MNAKGEMLESSYAACRRLCREAGSNFVGGFLLLPRPKRHGMDALYAFMRHTDDLVDNPHPDHLRRQTLLEWRGDLEHALLGNIDRHDRSTSANPLGSQATVGREILPAVADTVRRYRIPPDLLRDVIDGVELDLQKRRYETFDDLRQYCQLVASAVGLACIHIWGFRGPEAFEPARQCGLAMQLTNILRDLGEDVDQDRVYLPLEDLRAYDYSVDDLAAHRADDRFTRLVAFEAERAESYYHDGAELLGLLDADGQRVFGMMMSVYRALLRKIRGRPADVFRRRVRVSKPHKLLIGARWALLPPSTAALVTT
jgi:phytoene synthase